MRGKGCEKYGLAVMSQEEALIFCEAAIEGGSDPKTAMEDMKMIDAMLHMKHLSVKVRITYYGDENRKDAIDAAKTCVLGKSIASGNYSAKPMKAVLDKMTTTTA